VSETDYLGGAIFDLDGTLVDSEPIYAESDAAFLRRHGIRLDSGLGEFLGIGAKDFLLALEARFPDNPFCRLPLEERIRLKDESYLDLAQRRVRVFRPMVEVARELGRRGLVLGLASGSSPRVVERIFEITGLRGLFRAIVSSAEVERGKPDPRIFLEAARRMNVDPRRCIVFEDSGPGMAAAASAGMNCVALPDPASPRPAACDGARFVVEGGAGAVEPGPLRAALEGAGLLERAPRAVGRGVK